MVAGGRPAGRPRRRWPASARTCPSTWSPARPTRSTSIWPSCELLEQRYRDAGLTDITTDYHQGARHEVFNETNRDEITAHLLAWLERFA